MLKCPKQTKAIDTAGFIYKVAPTIAKMFTRHINDAWLTNELYLAPRKNGAQQGLKENRTLIKII